MQGSIYAHIPFCAQKCPYCDFYSIPYEPELVDRFLNAIHQEIFLRAEDSRLSRFRVTSIFFGGGTPSLLSARQIEKILTSLARHFTIAPAAEVSFEANPGTIHLIRLKEYRSLGFNRISIGVQSFLDADLRALGRIHNAQMARETFRNARQAGFENIGIDLISGIPKPSIKKWQHNLMQATLLQPDHISAYSLTVEPGTLLAQWLTNGHVHLGSDSLMRKMYLLALKELTRAGYIHYEISNYARPGFECKHNLAYWNGSPYLGLGPSAHSYYPEKRWWNVRDVRNYLSLLNAGRLPVAGYEYLSRSEQIMEFILLSLRKRAGIDLSQFAQRFGDSEKERLLEQKQKLSDDYFCWRDQNLALSPEGFLLYDSICAELVTAF